MHWFLPILGFGLALQVSGQLLNVQFNSNGLEKSGVKMAPYGSPEFQSLFPSLVNPASAVGADGIYPYSFVLTNTTKKTILMYSAQWEYDGPFKNRANITFNTWNLTGLQDATSDDIGPGTSRLVTPIMRLGRLPGPNAQTVSTSLASLLPKFLKSSSVVVKLQSVLWDDFSSSGPDGGNGVAHALAYLAAERDLMQEIVSAWGPSNNAAAVTQILSQEAGPSPGRMGVNASEGYEAAYKVYKQSRARSLSRLAANGVDKLVQMAQIAVKLKQYPTTPTP